MIAFELGSTTMPATYSCARPSPSDDCCDVQSVLRALVPAVTVQAVARVEEKVTQ